MKLTNKRRIFVEEYLKCWNATEAARRAGYKFPNRQGPRLLSFVGIKEKINQRLKEKVMSADEVLLRLAEQARADISEFVGIRGAIDWIAVQEKGHLIKKIIHRQGQHSSIELYDAQAALALLARHHGLLTDRREVEFKEPLEVKHGIDPGDAVTILDILARVGALPAGTGDAQDDEIHTSSADL